jgi:hypothetical protein
VRRAHPTRKNQPFPNSKKKFGGGKFKKCKGWFFLAGCVLALPKQAAGLGSHFALETGSSFVVKLSQVRTFLELVAHSGGFFFGCAERKPDVFLGRIGIGARQEPRLFFRPPQAVFSWYNERATNQ